MGKSFCPTYWKLIVGGLLLLSVVVGLTYAPPVSAKEIGKTIDVKAKGKLLVYTERIRLDREQFDSQYKKFSADREQYFRSFTEGLLAKHLKPYNLQASEWSISYLSEYRPKHEEKNYFSLLQCRIDGAWSRSWFKFQWLLKPILGDKADLYDFNYIEDGTGLLYEVKLKGVPITITLHFPKPIDHCHYHVWYQD